MKKHWVYPVIFICFTLFVPLHGASFQQNVPQDVSHILSQNLSLAEFTKLADNFYDDGHYRAAHEIYFNALSDHLGDQSLCGKNKLSSFFARRSLNLPRYGMVNIMDKAKYKEMRLQLAQTINNLGMLFQMWLPSKDDNYVRERYKMAHYCYVESLKIRSEFLFKEKEIGKSRHNIGAVLIILDKYKEAIQFLNDSLLTSWKDDPEAIDTHYLIALANEEMGRCRYAMMLYKEILVNPILKMPDPPSAVRETEEDTKERLERLKERMNMLDEYKKKKFPSQRTFAFQLEKPKPTNSSKTLSRLQPLLPELSVPKQDKSYIIKKQQLPKFDIKEPFESSIPTCLKKRPLSPSEVIDDSHEEPPSKKRKVSPENSEEKPMTKITLPSL